MYQRRGTLALQWWNNLELKIGGQAVIEGVMMRAPHSLSIAVRNPQGQIVVKNEKLKLLSDAWPIFSKPLLRGAVALVQSMVMGIRALNYSATSPGGGNR